MRGPADPRLTPPLQLSRAPSLAPPSRQGRTGHTGAEHALHLREQDKVQGEAEVELGTPALSGPQQEGEGGGGGQATLGGVLFEHMLCKHRGPLPMGEEAGERGSP